MQHLSSPNNGAVFLRLKKQFQEVKSSLFKTDELMTHQALFPKYPDLGTQIHPPRQQHKKLKNNAECAFGIHSVAWETIARLEREALMYIALQHVDSAADAHLTALETLQRLTINDAANQPQYTVPIRVI